MSTANSLPYGVNDSAVRTTLASGITSTDTSVDVGEVTNAPSTPFLISVFVDQSPLREDQMEIMEVTGISGTTLTVNRGQKGTAAQSFSSGDLVFMGIVPSDVFDEVSGVPQGVKNTIESNTQTSLENLLRSKANAVEHNNTKLDADDALFDIFADESNVFSKTDVSVTDVVNDGDEDGLVELPPKLSSPWDLSQDTSYDNVSFSVNNQDSKPQAIAFRNDGTKLFLAGNDTNSIYQYSLSTPWDINTSSFDNKSFDISGQDTFPTGLFFKFDGEKMFVLGNGGNNVYQYSLSTAWDISTASYDNIAFNVGSQDGGPQAIFLRSDGTNMFVVGNANQSVFQYSLSTGWDLSTASYSSIEFNVGGQAGIPIGIFFKSDGTKKFILDDGTNKIYQYSLSTPWDVTTASFDNVSFDVSGEENTPTGIFFKNDGAKTFVVGSGTNTIYQYTVATQNGFETAGTFASEAKNFYDTAGFVYPPDEAYVTLDADIPADEDVTATLADGYGNSVQATVGEFTDVSTLNSGIVRVDPLKLTSSDGNDTPTVRSYAVHIREGTGDWDDVLADFFPDESKITSKTDVAVTTEGSGTDGKTELPLDLNGFRLSDASYDGKELNISGQTGNAKDGFLKPDGTKLFWTGQPDDEIHQYTLSTPNDVSTASYDNITFSVGGQDNYPHGLFIRNDGKKFYITGAGNANIYQYSMSTAWDLSSASYDSTFYSISKDDDPTGVFFKDDGTRMFVIGYGTDTIYEYDLSTAWDVSSASYNNVSLDVSTEGSYHQDLYFSNNGNKLFTLPSSDTIHQYSLSTSWDLSSASYDNVFLDPESGNKEGIFFSYSGKKLYLSNNTHDDIEQYSSSSSGNSDNFLFPGTFNAPTQSLGYTPSAVQIKAVRTVPADESIEVDLTDENANTDTITTFGSKVSLSTITGTQITPTWRLKSSDGKGTPTLEEYDIRFYK